ncbi:protein of unknown function (plasmid) [Rhodovastum atsumiense]|nr:protein of unknown function [Rhodovastum atsumiense]
MGLVALSLMMRDTTEERQAFRRRKVVDDTWRAPTSLSPRLTLAHALRSCSREAEKC